MPTLRLGQVEQASVAYALGSLAAARVHDKALVEQTIELTGQLPRALEAGLPLTRTQISLLLAACDNPALRLDARNLLRPLRNRVVADYKLEEPGFHDEPPDLQQQADQAQVATLSSPSITPKDTADGVVAQQQEDLAGDQPGGRDEGPGAVPAADQAAVAGVAEVRGGDAAELASGGDSDAG